MVPLGWQSHTAYAAEPTTTGTVLTPDPDTLSTDGTDESKWQWDEGEQKYFSLNASLDTGASSMEVPFELSTFGTLQFDWMVSCYAGIYDLTYTLVDSESKTIKTQTRSEEEESYTTTKIDLLPGKYTLKFDYNQAGGSAAGTSQGYVKSLKLVTYVRSRSSCTQQQPI